MSVGTRLSISPLQIVSISTRKGMRVLGRRVIWLPEHILENDTRGSHLFGYPGLISLLYFVDNHPRFTWSPLLSVILIFYIRANETILSKLLPLCRVYA